MKKIIITVLSVVFLANIGMSQSLVTTPSLSTKSSKIRDLMKINADAKGTPSKIIITDYDETGNEIETYTEHRYYNQDGTVKGGVFQYTGNVYEGYAVAYENGRVKTIEYFDAIDSTLNGTSTFQTLSYEYDQNGIITKLIATDSDNNFEGYEFENTFEAGATQPSYVVMKETSNAGTDDGSIFFNCAYNGSNLDSMFLTQIINGDTLGVLKQSKITARNGYSVTYMDLLIGNPLEHELFQNFSDILYEAQKTVNFYQLNQTTQELEPILFITSTRETANGGCTKKSNYYVQGQTLVLDLILPHNSLGLLTERSILYTGQVAQSDLFNYTLNTDSSIATYTHQTYDSGAADYIDVRKEVYQAYTTTSVKNTFKTFDVYPNPVTGTTLRVEGIPAGNYTTQLFDITGRMIQSSTGMINQSLEIPSNLANGVYTLSIQNGNAAFQTKFVK
jgi:hypothetical protein